jgi:hypothetical protein
VIAGGVTNGQDSDQKYLDKTDHRRRNPFPLMSKGESNFRGEKHHHRGRLCMKFVSCHQ